ncbi:MAG: mannitol dehydrogenase family protein, partial [Clostridiales bacterium]|nr:mannitol dehydrogenase family protein [Clostridiales bacterium]MDY4111178.1 mannitol dehydrogenase family protein [Roseburia sp.]
GWLRYLMGIDDNGNTFTPSPDPLLAEVRPYVADIQLGDRFDADALLRPLLSDAKIWGVNLYEVGMASLVCDYFTQMTSGVGAVAKTLQEVLA